VSDVFIDNPEAYVLQSYKVSAFHRLGLIQGYLKGVTWSAFAEGALWTGTYEFNLGRWICSVFKRPFGKLVIVMCASKYVSINWTDDRVSS
jgi:hypothetical protein